MFLLTTLLPAASVEDIKVSITHRSSVCLVGQVGWSLGEGGHAPVKVIRSGRVPPATSVSVKAALSLDNHSTLRNSLAHTVVECDIVHRNVPTGTVVAPDSFNHHLQEMVYIVK